MSESKSSRAAAAATATAAAAAEVEDLLRPSHLEDENDDYDNDDYRY